LKNTLLILIKNPRPGYVKTRLARTVGDEAALRIYRYLLGKTRVAAQGVRAERVLCYSDVVETNDDWPEADFIKTTQAPGDLGARMAASFQSAFDKGAEKAVIIGSDCPALTGALLQRAFDALDHSDFVLGPTPDGGYYLLGMRHFDETVFQNIEWSTDSVRAHTLDRIAAAGKTCALMPVLSDVDTEEDWLAYTRSAE
jgi:rSAM/selenodomain-associated transferase 1